MTQATVTRATGAGSFRLPASRRRGGARTESAPATGATRVDVVTPVETRRLGSGAFAFLCGLLLVAGLVTVLLLNTARAQQSYTLGDLQSQQAQLTDSKQELNADINGLSSPQTLALAMLRAGYVPAGTVRYVDKSTHKLLGVSTAESAGSYSVLTLPSTPASAVANQAVKLSDSGLLVQTATSSATKASPTASAKASASATASASAKASAPASASASATPTAAASAPAATSTAKATSPTSTAAPSAAQSAAATR